MRDKNENWKCWDESNKVKTTAHPWCDSHFTNISACGGVGARVGVQVSRRELYIHIDLN